MGATCSGVMAATEADEGIDIGRRGDAERRNRWVQCASMRGPWMRVCAIRSCSSNE